MATAIERTNIIKLVTAMFNAAPGSVYLSELVVYFDASGGTSLQKLSAMATALGNTTAYKNINPAFQIASEFASVFLTPYGLQANAEAIEFITAKFNAGVPKGQIAFEATLALNNSTAAAFADARAILDNKTAVAEYFSVTKAVAQTTVSSLQSVISSVTKEASSVTAANTAIDNGAGAPAGTSFTLTTGVDTLTGGSGNETFVAAEANIGALDNINGGAGTDTLYLQLTSATNLLTSTNFSNFETITVNQVTNDGTVTLSGLTGITAFNNNASTKAVAITGSSVSNAAATLSITNVTTAGANTTLTFTEAAVAGTSDVAAVTVSNVTGALDVNIDTATGNTVGFESVSLTSAGTANSITLKSNDTSVTTVNIAGSTAITVALGTNVTTTAVTVNASTATGAVTVSGFGTAVHTVTGGTGNDVFIFTDKYVGGATGATRDIISGGNGTDTLSVELSGVTAATTAQSNLTSIETLTISDAWANASDINITRFADVTTLNLAAATAGTSTATLKSGTTVVLAGDSATNSVTSFAVTGTATTDTMTLNMAGFDFAGTGTETLTGIETLNINTGATVTTAAVFADALTFAPSAGTSIASIVVTGANAMTFTGVVTAANIDATALTGALTVTGTAAQAVTIRGGTAGDTLGGSASADLIVGGNGIDVITARAGNDSIDLTETTAAIDRVVFSGGGSNTATAANTLTANGMDTITGFGATDVINIVALGDSAIASATLTGTLSAAAATSVFANDSVYIINTAATAGALTTGGTATVTDFTNMTQVAGFLSERFSHTASTADIAGVIVWNVGTTSYVYNFDSLVTGGTAIEAAEVVLVGTITQTAALVQANIAIT